MVHRWWKCIVLLISISCHREVGAPADTLRIGLFAPYTSLDPIYARDQVSVWLVQQLFMGLVTYDTAMNILPAAAYRWEISPDGRLYRFYLRNDLQYVRRPGQYLRAQDVVYSWTRLADPRWASPGSYLFRGLIRGWAEYQQGKAPHISGLRAISDSLLEVELEEPYAPFLHLLTLPYAAIVHPPTAESLGRDFARFPVGLGPFYLLHEERDRLLVLKRDTGTVRKLIFRWYSNRFRAWEALKRGEIDAFEGTDRALEYRLRRDSHWKQTIDKISVPQLGTEYIGMDLRPQSPLTEKQVRRALRHLIWQLPLKAALEIECTPARTFIPPALLAHVPVDTTPPAYADVEKLKTLHLTLYASPAFRELCEYIQSALARKGIPLQIEYLLGPSLREQIAKGSIHLWKASWLADFPDGENFLILFESTQRIPSGPNTTRFAHPEMDSLIARAKRNTNAAERRLLYSQAESLLLAEAPVIPLYHGHGVWFVSRRVKGFPRSPLPVWLPLRDVRLKNLRSP